MKISKSLFKDLTRCANFPALYDMYINRKYHHVKNIENNNQILNDLQSLGDNLFDTNTLEDAIFSQMFDEESGEDLINQESLQLQIFGDTFKKVESLAVKYIEKVFGHPIISSELTKEQKKFEFSEGDNTYYCYLDGFFCDDNTNYIFEVKSTTSKKFDSLSVGEFPLFSKNERGIYSFSGYNYIGCYKNKKQITKQDIDKELNKLLDRCSECGIYIFDLAVERFIVDNSNKKLDNKYYLVVLNHEYTYDGVSKDYSTDENGNELFKIYDLTEITLMYQDKIKHMQTELIENINNLEYYTNRFSRNCQYNKTTQCKFFNVCAPFKKCNGSIFEYINKHRAFKDKTTSENLDIYEVLNKGIYKMEDASEYLKNINNIYQLNCLKNNTSYINKEAIKYALSNIKYPVYYLDFESLNNPLPRFYKEKPYTQSVFQYSLHTELNENTCDLERDHHQFLAKDLADHRKELVESLINDIDLSHGGTVIVYNDIFEKSRIREFSEIFPEYKEQLININDHIFDLYRVLQGEGYMYKKFQKSPNLPSFKFYDNRLHGSFSIKKVLPIFTKLSYNSLDVRNGQEAMLFYSKLNDLTDEEYLTNYLGLTIYCRQDTWSMVEIIRKLREIIKE